MIVGTVTVYRCDHDGCDEFKGIASDGLDNETGGWFLGVYHHFCPAHRDRVAASDSTFRIPHSPFEQEAVCR